MPSLSRDGPGRIRTYDSPVKSRELCLLSYGTAYCMEWAGVEPASAKVVQRSLFSSFYVRLSGLSGAYMAAPPPSLS